MQPLLSPTDSPVHRDVSVRIDGATRRFGDFVAVRDVSLDIHRGEFFSLLGSSGCGKTTLLRMIAGFEHPTHGTISINGKDMTGQPPYRRPVNLVFQHFALFPHLNVEKNVAFGLRYQHLSSNEQTHRIGEALELVRLTGLNRRYPNELSGGQKQRVALARALVLRPQVLLLDEPLGALDQKLRKEMQVELKNLQRTLGITFIFVTHDQEEALTMSDRIAVMNGGRIEQCDHASTLFELPRNTFVAQFMGAGNFMAATVLEIAGDRAVVQAAAGFKMAIPLRGKAIAPGAKVQFIVRPEKLRLSAAPPTGGADAVRVEVVERIYQGLSTVWTVRNAAGEKLTVYEQNTEPSLAPVLQRHEVLYLSWDPRHAVLMEPEANS